MLLYRAEVVQKKLGWMVGRTKHRNLTLVSFHFVQKGFTKANLLFMDLTFSRLRQSYLTSADFVHLL